VNIILDNSTNGNPTPNPVVVKEGGNPNTVGKE